VEWERAKEVNDWYFYFLVLGRNFESREILERLQVVTAAR